MGRQLEKSFQRAIFLSFSKKKFFLVFPVLILCGIFIIFCRVLAFGSVQWVTMSLVFLPIFLASGILLSLGVLLIRIYYHEAKGLAFDFKKILRTSWELVVGTSYLSTPPILAYLLLWIVLGVFILLKEIPYIGPYMGIIMSFIPFLIILFSILLVFFNICLLFFVSPAIALNASEKFSLKRGILTRLKEKLFISLSFFLIAFLPSIFILGFLILAGVLTNIHYLIAENAISIAIQWFFMMIPFCVFLTPPVIFFFNFAAESYNLLRMEEN